MRSTGALESQLEWMRERQRKRQEKEARRAPVVEVAPPRPVEPLLLPRMLRVKQVAALLGVSVSSVQRWFGSRAVVVQGPRKRTIMIPQRVLDEWIREHSNSRGRG